MNLKRIICLSILVMLLWRCTIDNNGSSGVEATDQEYSVICHQLSDAQTLNPITSVDHISSFILEDLFYSLMEIDYNTLKLVPVIAESEPTVEIIGDTNMHATYYIRPEAKFDDGSSITAKDVEFSLKVILNPLVDNHHIKSTYKSIKNIQLYENDPLKLTFICDEVSNSLKLNTGEIDLLPKSIYDPNGLMDGFSIKELAQTHETLKANPKIVEFAEEFNSEKYQRKKNWIQGCGPYYLEEWNAGQQIVLKRKENWWGNKLKGKGPFFEVYPTTIIHRVINDPTTAKEALLGHEIDVMRDIKAKDFEELKKNKGFLNDYKLHSPDKMAYAFLGINTKKDIFSNKKVRKALAHLVDVNQIIDVILEGYGIPITGPIHPNKKKHINPHLSPYTYDPKKSKKILDDLGWKDLDGDGILENTVQGETQQLEITYLVNQTNDNGKAIGLLFQEEARKIGIKVNLITVDFSVLVERLFQHDFDIFFGGFIPSPVITDHRQILHTSSYGGGSNFTGFGNEKSDQLIDSISAELNEDKRALLNQKLQQIIHDECASIYLYAAKGTMAINNKFSYESSSLNNSGYRLSNFMLKDKTTQHPHP